MKQRRRSTVRSSAPTPTRREASAPQLVQIEKPIYGGDFLARLDGKAVFVPLALPGEQARVRIVEEKRGYAKAELEEVISSAPQRAAPPCPHFGACGGCQYQHTVYEAQLGLKQQILRETMERGGVAAPRELDVLAAQPWAYRNRIRLAFDATGNPGYRGRRSHAILPVAECPIAAPALVQAALAAAALLKPLPSHARPAELALFCDAEGSSLLASIFVAGSASQPLKSSLDGLLQQIPALRGVELVEQRANQPAQTVVRKGEDALTYHAAGFDFRVDHGAFFQVNRFLVDALVQRVAAGRTGKVAWDLFAGVGLFARQLAVGFERVVAVESAAASTAALAHNLHETPGSAVAAQTLEFLRRSRRGQRPDLVVVDPPRSGLGAETTALLAEIAAPAITYVSCDPATLARDLRDLTAAGYSLDRVTLADLFPQTFHLETIVDLRLQTPAL
jgi:23S rRNA (uracil1939-C5)-methyltransferase